MKLTVLLRYSHFSLVQIGPKIEENEHEDRQMDGLDESVMRFSRTYFAKTVKVQNRFGFIRLPTL